MPAKCVKRNFYRAAMEPADGVIHGAGQDVRGFADYCQALGPDRLPIVYMTYTSLRKDLYAWQEALSSALQGLSHWAIPQLGLAMTRDSRPEQHYEHQVAAGEYDEQIDVLGDVLIRLGRPLFIRIGYEFNGHWNGYVAETYVPTWRRVVDRLRARKIPAAYVWCCTPHDLKECMRFYPGDEYVDWWGIDLFSPEDLSDPRTFAFLEAAHKHKKPMMIGESTPRYVGTADGGKSWARWFKPYFELIRAQAGIKAFCYINWDWIHWSKVCEIDWSDWRDGRIEGNPSVLQSYRGEMANAFYIHAGTPQETRTRLRLD